MTSIYLSNQGFENAAELARTLEARNVTVHSDASTAQDIHSVIVHRSFERAQGFKAITDLARGLGAKAVYIIDTAAEAFTMRQELGGRCVSFDMTADQAADLHSGVWLHIVDAICAPLTTMVAADKKTRHVMHLARRVAQSDVTVFVNGPTGSGKEVLSRYIHDHSARKDAPFIAINCAAIPENMLEAMLFGHEKGSFTGATAAGKGYFRAAHGGTLLLDEISEMPLALQAKLLRVIQERKVTPLGSQKEEEVDVRLIATSNRDMANEVAKGTFREDLYYRLHVFPVHSLSLAARRDDVTALAAAMIRRHWKGAHPVPVLTAQACEILTQYDWPGNVRELENVIQRALVLSDGSTIEAEHIMIDTAALPQILPSSGAEVAAQTLEVA